jgi:hypothetical protein
MKVRTERTRKFIEQSATAIMMLKELRHRRLLSLTVGLSLLSALVAPTGLANHTWSTSGAAAPTIAAGLPPMPSAEAQASVTYGKTPLYFEENRGQVDSQVNFLTRAGGAMIFLTPTEAVFVRTVPSADTSATTADKRRDPLARPTVNTPPQTAVMRMQLSNANAHPEVVGLDQQEGIVNYFIGNDPAQWHPDIPTYGRVQYRDVYPGIDMVYYGQGRQLEYDFVVQPNADVNSVSLKFSGADDVQVDPNGDLVIETSAGEVRQQKPSVYQEADGSRQEIQGRYLLKGNGEVGFSLGGYDRSQQLIIDPVLAYSTYLGGSEGDQISGITVDSAGQAYIVGSTISPNFPTVNPIQATVGIQDAFITKLNANGSALIYSTYLGGDNYEVTGKPAVDGAGNLYLTGATQSANFPTVHPFQSTKKGLNDAFLAKINSNGSALLYSTYLGGSSDEDGGAAVAVDSAFNAYVAGVTSSTDFPTMNPFQSANASGGGRSGFITKFNANGSALIYSTYLGGSNPDFDSCRSIAIDAAGNAYVTGPTISTDFPTMNPIQAANAGQEDVFVTKLNASGSALVYSTYLGGAASESGNDIAVDSSGNAYVAGFTASDDFPTVLGLQGNKAGEDGFVARLNSNGTSLIYSTYLGGNNNDSANGIAVDSAGNAYVTGSTSSTNFPNANAIQTTSAGGLDDAFVTKINTGGSAFLYSTYLGGSDQDGAFGIAIDSAGNAYVTGDTSSTNFPVTSDSFQPAGGGAAEQDIFISKIGSYGIAGRVLNGSNIPIFGVTVTLSGSDPGNILTNNNGDFSFLNTTPGGNYTVTPYKFGYTFTPQSITINELNNSQDLVFIGTTATPTPTPTPTPSTVQFGQSFYSIFEDCTAVTLTVARTGDTSSAATVDYSTQPGTASDHSDFDTAIGTLSFAPGETAKSFDVLITEDSFVEPTESFTVALSNPVGVTLGSSATATVQIFDDSPESTGNPIDAPDDFVCQHYHDFLNREDDSAGLAFWTGTITSCGTDAACILERRVNASGAFFLSIEFQETGGFAIRAQRAAFGKKSVDPTKRITYSQFIHDARFVGDGVIVGQPGYEARLEANKQAYINQVAASAAFTSTYPSTMTADQFVDALFASAGVTPSASDRQAAINAFDGGGIAGRAAALRSVSDSGSLRVAEFSPQFVLMQYFGYLRRNPTDAPDNNDNGYQFWLTKLNNFNGDFQKAEMVKAFILSAEYRSRFGQP